MIQASINTDHKEIYKRWLDNIKDLSKEEQNKIIGELKKIRESRK